MSMTHCGDAPEIDHLRANALVKLDDEPRAEAARSLDPCGVELIEERSDVAAGKWQSVPVAADREAALMAIQQMRGNVLDGPPGTRSGSVPLFWPQGTKQVYKFAVERRDHRDRVPHRPPILLSRLSATDRVEFFHLPRPCVSGPMVFYAAWIRTVFGVSFTYMKTAR